MVGFCSPGICLIQRLRQKSDARIIHGALTAHTEKIMTTIIAGRFMQNSDATATMAALMKSGFTADRISSFFVNPPGQHDSYPIGGDENESAGTETAGTGAVYGAAGGGGVGIVVGLVTAPVLGPAAVVAGAAAGSYVGALVGALNTMKTGDATISEATSALESAVPAPSVAAPSSSGQRKSGTLVAVAAVTAAEEDRALQVMRTVHAVDIERAEGTISEGEWTDFDPLTLVDLIPH